MNRLETGRIIPNFNGNLASELVWQQDVLNGFSKSVHLWTNVVIKESNRMGRASVVNMGEVLAWRRFASPADLFRKTVDKDKIVEVSDSGPGPAEIIINHKILVAQINKGGERFNKDEYVHRLNTSVAKGLLSIAAKEKISLAGASLAYTGLTFLPAAFFGFLAWSDFNNPVTDSESKKIMLVFLDTTAGSLWLLLATSGDRKLLEDGYSPGDIYNPFKHIKNLISGSLYLTENQQRLVFLDK